MENFEVEAIVEIPKYSMYKYEIDKEDKTLLLDRPLKEIVPFNYGFIPQTLSPDSDQLDVFVLSFGPIYPLTKVKVIIVGAFKCIDNGISDDKIIATLVGEENSANIEAAIKSIKYYLSVYKEGFVVGDFVGPEEAKEILMRDVYAYQNA